MRLTCRALLEGLRFLWSCRHGSRAYWRWRLGTLYGSFDATGALRPLSALLRDLWTDRRQALSFLLWRRELRELASRAHLHDLGSMRGRPVRPGR